MGAGYSRMNDLTVIQTSQVSTRNGSVVCSRDSNKTPWNEASFVPRYLGMKI